MGEQRLVTVDAVQDLGGTLSLGTSTMPSGVWKPVMQRSRRMLANACWTAWERMAPLARRATSYTPATRSRTGSPPTVGMERLAGLAGRMERAAQRSGAGNWARKRRAVRVGRLGPRRRRPGPGRDDLEQQLPHRLLQPLGVAGRASWSSRSRTVAADPASAASARPGRASGAWPPAAAPAGRWGSRPAGRCALLLALDGLPVPHDLAGRGHPQVAEDVRVAADQLLGDRPGHPVDVEVAGVLGQLGGTTRSSRSPSSSRRCSGSPSSIASSTS